MREQRDDVHELLDRAVTDEIDLIGETAVCSALQAVVGTVEGGIEIDEALGRTRLDASGDAIDGDTRFDIASLTKPMVTATLLMQAVEAGRLDWDDPVDAHLNVSLAVSGVDEPTLLQLANHTSGLPDWTPLYENLHRPSPERDDSWPKRGRARRRRACRHIAELGLEAPPGEREVYSDLGYILLATMLEVVYNASLEQLAETHIFEPLDLRHTAFAPLGAEGVPLEGAVATEEMPDRGGLVAGVVHDRNTAALGGVSGHAGVFSTARDVWRFGCHMAAIDRDASLERDPLVQAETLRMSWSLRANGGLGHHVGGWDTPSGEPSSAGRGFQAEDTIGHLGFTGTSIWIERDRGLIAVLLTNRVYPSRDNDRIDDLRLDFHEAVLPP